MTASLGVLFMIGLSWKREQFVPNGNDEGSQAFSARHCFFKPVVKAVFSPTRTTFAISLKDKNI